MASFNTEINKCSCSQEFPNLMREQHITTMFMANH
jgi:hypothetical protein